MLNDKGKKSGGEAVALGIGFQQEMLGRKKTNCKIWEIKFQLEDNSGGHPPSPTPSTERLGLKNLAR